MNNCPTIPWFIQTSDIFSKDNSKTMFMQGLVRATCKVCSGRVGGGGGADNTEYSRHLGKKITYADRSVIGTSHSFIIKINFLTMKMCFLFTPIWLFLSCSLKCSTHFKIVRTNTSLSCSLKCSTHFKISLHGLLKDMSMLKDLYAN